MSHTRLPRLLIIVRLLGLGVSLAFFIPPTAAQSADEANLRALAERFVTAYGRQDIDGVMSLWSPKAPDLAASRRDFQQVFAAAEKFELRGFTIRKIILDGEKATVRLVIEMKAVDAKAGEPATGSEKLNRTFHCTKEGADWKIREYLPSEAEVAAALVTAKTEEERAELLAAEKDFGTVELDSALIAEGRRMMGLGRYKDGLAIFDHAAGIAEKGGDKVGNSTALRLIGAIHYYQGDYGQAVKYVERAVLLAEGLDNKEPLAAAHNLAGAVNEARSNFEDALAYYQKCLRLAAELRDEGLIGIVQNNIGNVHHKEGDYTKALEHYQRSLEIAGHMDDKEGIAVALSNIGSVHDSQGNYSQGLEHFQKSLNLARSIAYKPLIATTLRNMGEAYRELDNYVLALRYYQESNDLAIELGDNAEICSVFNSLGNLYRLQGRYEESRDQYQKGLKLAEEIGNKRGTTDLVNGLARLYELQGDYTHALEMAGRAGDIAKETNLPEFSWVASTIAGRCYRALNQPEKAGRAFADAIATIEKMRTQVAGGEQERQRFFETKVSPYYAMVDLLIGQHSPAEALAYAERAKGRALLDVLGSGKININKATTAVEQKEERRLNGEIVSLNTQIYREKTEPQTDQTRLADLNARLQQARLEYEAFQTSLFAVHPDLKTQRGETRPLTLKESGILIPDARTALLEFVVLEDKTYLFALTGSEDASQRMPDLKVYTLKIKEKGLSDLARRFRQRLGSHDFSFYDLASQLYDLLLKPARAQLQNKTNLVIVPDGVLWELPFQALQPARNRYLIEDFAISYAPSLTVLREMIKPRGNQTLKATPFPTLLAFGNPAIGKETAERVTAVFMDEQLLPLPEAERQVRTLGRLYGAASSKVYVGAEAREDRAKLEASHCRILHLATHGILNNASPMYSHLVLSQPQAGADEDGLLEAWEIVNLELNADLVVLSACDTARGRVGAGEGVIGLAWAFFVAGCPTTVASQWKVESSSTTELMVELHRNLKPRIENPKARITKAEALRLAALKLIRSKQYRHPFYWAGFVMIGDGR